LTPAAASGSIGVTMPLPPPDHRTAPWAEFSPCYRYRYLLAWPTGLNDDLGLAPHDPRYALFVLANPSTATAEVTDPTVARCIAYAKRWGYGWCHVVNVRAWRATDPKLVPSDSTAISDPKQPMRNDDAICMQAHHAAIVVCGWGKLAGTRGPHVLALLRKVGVTPYALALNDDGTPRHPLARGKLALRKDAQPVRMEP